MNNHEEFEVLISAALDGELTAAEQTQLEAHLADCAACRAQLAQYTKLSAALKTAWPNESLSPDLETRLGRERQSSKREQTMKTSTPWIRVGAGFAVCALVAVSVTTYVQRGMQGRMRNASIYMSGDYIKQGIHGRLRSATDDIGDQYSPGNTNIVSMNQYEPYYLSTDFTKNREQHAGARADRLASLPAAANEMVTYEMPGTLARIGTEIKSAEMVAEELVRLDTKRADKASAVEKLTESEAVLSDVVVPRMPPPPVPPRQTAQFNTESYERIYENPFLAVTQNPLSTFSIDVDTASYSNVRRFLNNGQLPPPDAVRIEELVNYFVYDYPQPEGEAPFSINTEVAPCPWNPQNQLMLVGLQGKNLAATETPPSNLVFLIDVSGSMNQANKLPLLKSAFQMMVNQLQPDETISIVTYAGSAGLVLPPTSGRDKTAILEALDRLQAGGSTAGGQGIRLAYQTAEQQFIEGGNNRVILATDGDFNVGVSSDADMTRLIEEKRDAGIFLTVLGFGTGNYKDSKMESIADHGNGNYYYIDTHNEAKKVLVDELGSTLFTIAKDVKLQLEFNPAQVQSYRLIGYENRLLDKEDFNDDTKDAGELGAGHTVTALYELVPVGSETTTPGVDALKYQSTAVVESSDLVTVKLRYKQPDSNTSQLLTQVLSADARKEEGQVSDNFRLAAGVAEFGLLLRHSEFKGNASFNDVKQRLQSTVGQDKYGYRAELLGLVERAEQLLPNPDGGYRMK